MTPLLDAREARIAASGVTLIDRLTLATSGDRVVIAGDARALFEAITGVPSTRMLGDDDDPGLASVVSGTLLLAGKSVPDGAHTSIIGAAPLDPPMPPRWTAEAYVTWGVRLAGIAAGPAKALALGALASVGLHALQRTKVRAFDLPQRRALVLAQAIATGPAVLVADQPLAGLGGAAAEFVDRALRAAMQGRRALISTARIDPASAESTVLREADEVVVIAGGQVAIQAPPSELFAGARVMTVAVSANGERFKEELAQRGIALRGGPLRFWTALPEGATTRELLAAAIGVGAAVIEMVPVIG